MAAAGSSIACAGRRYDRKGPCWDSRSLTHITNPSPLPRFLQPPPFFFSHFKISFFCLSSRFSNCRLDTPSFCLIAWLLSTALLTHLCSWTYTPLDDLTKIGPGSQVWKCHWSALHVSTWASAPVTNARKKTPTRDEMQQNGAGNGFDSETHIRITVDEPVRSWSN